MKYSYLLAILILIGCNSYGQGYDGLIARWPFNGNANDVSGNGMDGIPTNVTPDTGYNGLPNTAYRFDGASSHIIVPYSYLMNITYFSICALIKPDGFYSGACQANTIIWRNTTGPQPTDHYGITLFDNDYDDDCNVFSPDHEVFTVDANNWTAATSADWLDTPVQLHQWYCVVGECKNDSILLYINGVLRKHLPTDGPITSSTVGMDIGADTYNAQFPYWFNGKMDEMRIYNRALSAEEVNTFCDSATMPAPSEVANTLLPPDVHISPNPAHGDITVRFSGADYTGDVQLLNSLGQIVSSQVIQGASMYISMNGLPDGMYFVKCRYNGLTTVQRILKQ